MLVNITDLAQSEISKIKSLLGENTLNCLASSHTILAGGALTSLFTRKDINDFDIYFRGKEGFSNFIRNVYNLDECSEDLESHNLIVNFATDRSILCRESTTGNDIQLIAYKMFPDIGNIFDAFDFTINMCAYDFFTGEMWAHKDFLKHCSQRYLSFNSGTDYPIVSALRVQKYVERGYDISKSEMLRILFTIADKKYDSWEKVKSEVVGMYGIPIEKVFNENEPFSLKEVVKQLSNSAKVNNSTVSAQSICVEDLYKKFPTLLDKKGLETKSDVSGFIFF